MLSSERKKQIQRHWRLYTLIVIVILIIACLFPLGSILQSVKATPASAPSTQGLHIEGRYFFNSQNQIVTLRGASRWSLEFSCQGDSHFQVSDFQAMKSWGMNAVRITTNSAYWSGVGCNATDYQALVDNAVHNAEAAGLFVILVDQWNTPNGGNPPMASNLDLTYWQQVAAKYARDANVAFVPVTEPHDVSWQVWHDGGDGYVGMQQLVNVINTAAPNRIVFVNGLSWADDLSGLTNGYAIAGKNLAYEVHVYRHWDPATDFENISSTSPVIAGEFGLNDNVHNYVSDVMTYFENNHTGYFAWAWDNTDNHSLLQSGGQSNGWDGTPTVPYGLPVRNFMQLHANDASPVVPDTGNASTVVPDSSEASPIATSTPTIAITNGNGNGLAATPPMGWNLYNYFGNCGVNTQLVEQQANALVSSGMAADGYQYINIDDCWESKQRQADGTITSDPGKFPRGSDGSDGIKVLASYIHSLHLKFGLYTDAGTTTCAGLPGTYGHETQDAQTYVSWGVDFVKEDACNMPSGTTPEQGYVTFRNALAQAVKNAPGASPILFSLCDGYGQKPLNDPDEWGPTIGNMWRTTPDIYTNTHSWANIVRNVDINSQYAAFAGPGGWNDPDLLEVGNGNFSDTQNRSQFSLWSIMAAPLIASTDLVKMSDVTKSIFTNSEVIAVDQDPLGKQGTVVEGGQNQGQEVWAKPLQDGTVAVVLFNRSDSSAADITVDWNKIGLPAGSEPVRDLWAHADLGPSTDSYTAKAVPADGVVMLKIGTPTSLPTATPTVSSATQTPTTTGTPAPLNVSESVSYEAELPTNVLAGSATVSACANCSGGQEVSSIGTNCPNTNASDGTLTFNVDSPNAGTINLTIYYVNGAAQSTASMSVNGGTGSTINFANTGGPNTVSSLTTTVNLVEGHNSIQFSNATACSADLDRIIIQY